MMNVLNFILQRVKERSTWLGLVSIGTAAGMTLRPDVQEAVIAAGMSLAGLVLALTKDSAST
jgi:hypothetical protein